MFCFFILFFCSVPAAAQVVGVLEGQVFDPSGKVISGAIIEIINLEMGGTRQLVADHDGRYQAPGLLPGSYRIEASHPGFRGEIREPVVLNAGRVIEVDFHLTLGNPEERVVVNADTPLLSTRASDWGSSIELRKLEDFPLSGRDLFDLAAQAPGTAVATSAKLGLATGWGLHLTVNGSRSNQNSFRLDGLYINDATNIAPASAAGALLGIEGIAELRIVSSPFSAEYGRAAGAPITAVSKSGSNHFHGSVYEYLRNSRLDAKNFFDSADQKIPSLRRNQFGTSLGGPILENRLFFFANYEGIRSTRGETQISTTLTAEARNGILDSSNGSDVIIVAPEIKPYLDLYPSPNAPEVGNAAYRSEMPTTAQEDLLTGRIDYNVSEKLRIFSRYTFDDAESSYPDPFHVWTFPSDSQFHFFQAEYQYTPSSKSIYLFRAGFSRIRNSENIRITSEIPSDLSFLPERQLGAIYVTGLTPLGGREARLRPRGFTHSDLQFSFDVTRILGKHTLHFGASFDRIRLKQRSDLDSFGLYRFTSIADFLEASPSAGELMYPGSDSIRDWRQSLFSGFFQDEFRVRRNLSGTLGLRYEAYTTPSEINGKVATIPDPLHDSTVTIGGPLFKNPSATNFAPRVSIAWDAFGNGETVLRAGFGVFFDLLGMRELLIAGARMPPFFYKTAISNPEFPDLLEAALSIDPEIGLDTVDFHPNQPYTMQYQLSIERKIGANAVVRSTYTGMRGVHVLGQMGNINPPTPVILDDGSPFFPEDAPRLNPAFGRIATRRTAFNSFHNAFHIEVQKRWNDRWSSQFKYSLSKTIDETSAAIITDYLSSDQFPTMLSYRDNRGLSDFDVRHLFTGNFSYRLADWGSGFVRILLGGWEAHGLFQVQSGFPFSPFVGFDRAHLNPGSDDLGQRPDLIAVPGTQLILGDPNKYFNDEAFGLPSEGMYGNLGRNALTGPGSVTVDLAFHKDIWNRDQHNVRFRLEIFNLPNHPNFQIPSELDLFNSREKRLSAAGGITETSTRSRKIQVALKWTF